MSIEKPMVDVEEESLARLVRATVGEELDGQRGRAGRAFARAVAGGGNGEMGMVDGGMVKSEEGVTGGRGRWRVGDREGEFRRLRFWAGAASGLAACLALVVGLQMWRRPAERGGAGERPAVAASVPVMDQVEFTRNVEGPTVVVADSPMRVVRQQTLKKTEWFDAGENAHYSVIQPVERVGYVRLQPY